MGHAGAWTGIGEGTSEAKYKALEAAGVTMVDHPAKFGGVMKDILAKFGRNVNKIVSLIRIQNLLLKPDMAIGTISSQCATTTVISHLPPPPRYHLYLLVEIPSAKALPASYGRAVLRPPVSI